MGKQARRHRRSGRITPKGTRPHERSHRGGTSAPGPLLDMVGDCVHERSGAALLELASSIVELGTSRPADQWTGTTRSDLGELVTAFAESGVTETAALAWAMVPMLTPSLAARVRTSLGGPPAGPRWLLDLHEPSVTGTLEMTDVLGDGDNLMIGVHWPSGGGATAVCYVDHNLGTVVKDAFIVPDRLAVVEESYQRLLRTQPHQEDQTLRPLDPAATRARLGDAIRHGEIMLPPRKTKTWPAVRPLVEWWSSLLPARGTGYAARPPSDRARAALVRKFMASPFASELSAPKPVVEDFVDALLWYSGSRGQCDPLQWSVVMVEIVLVDFFPRKVDAPLAARRELPTILTALVRFAHAERGIRSGLTDEVITGIKRWSPQFFEAIRQHDDDEDQDEGQDGNGYSDFDDGRTSDEIMRDIRDRLVEELGGRETIAALDETPLPDRPFDWEGVPAALVTLVAEALEKIDDVCGRGMDQEMVTLARELLHVAMTSDAPPFRSAPNPGALAGGVIWATYSFSGGSYGPPASYSIRTQKQLAEALGVSPGVISQRATRLAGLATATGVWSDPRGWHSRRRRSQLERLQRLDEWIAEHGEE